jgi:GTP-binding protein Era
MSEGEQHAGFVAIIGAPNAGKSTLVNALVGAKISIVTHKVQTTRARVRGILMKGATQVVLVDTPGIFAPRRRLDRAMVGAAWTEAGDADVTALLVDASKPGDVANDPILGQLLETGRRRILVVNKVDKVDKPKLFRLVEALNARVPFEQTFMVSALDGSGVGDLATWLASAMPKGEWMFPEDQIADAPLRLTAAELTREKLYLRLHEELPYASTVETTAWKEMKDGSVRIEQTIFVERDSQRRIVLGHKGETIKAISMEARKDIAAVLERKVHLFLFVKVDERWGDSKEHYTALGLDFPKS